ncbi:MAG: hypothetical protein JJU02_16695, partial [Cryomorphaceae bacterium]|nr:hypothetical protein [Cryomorphaceae bacterium]
MTKTKQIKIHKQTLLGLLVLFVFPVFAQQNPDVRYHKFFEQYISGYTLTILDSFAYVHARLPTNQFTSVFTKIHINGTVEKDFVPFSDNFPIHFSAFWETTQVLSDSNILFSGLREGLPFVQYLYKVSPDLDSVWHWEKRSDTVRGIIRFVHPYKEFFLVLGDEQHFPSYDVNIYLRKFTNDGELLWQVDIYPPGPAISDTSHQMVQTRS